MQVKGYIESYYPTAKRNRINRVRITTKNWYDASLSRLSLGRD